jgi:hypothetical protein
VLSDPDQRNKYNAKLEQALKDDEEDYTGQWGREQQLSALLCTGSDAILVWHLVSGQGPRAGKLYLVGEEGNASRAVMSTGHERLGIQVRKVPTSCQWHLLFI